MEDNIRVTLSQNEWILVSFELAGELLEHDDLDLRLRAWDQEKRAVQDVRFRAESEWDLGSLTGERANQLNFFRLELLSQLD